MAPDCFPAHHLPRINRSSPSRKVVPPCPTRHPPEPRRPTTPASFPAGFLWGTVDRLVPDRGRRRRRRAGSRRSGTPSAARPGATHNGDTGDVACDHYLRLDSDLDLLGRSRRPGSTAARSPGRGSSRPGKGPANPTGSRLLPAPRRRSARPRGIVTGGHASTTGICRNPSRTPAGWVVRDTAERFAEYAAIVAEGLGDSVEMWTTLNEPWCSAWQGYGSRATTPPGAGTSGRPQPPPTTSCSATGLGSRGPAGRPARAARVGHHPQPGARCGRPPGTRTTWPPPERVDGNLNRLFPRARCSTGALPRGHARSLRRAAPSRFLGRRRR